VNKITIKVPVNLRTYPLADVIEREVRMLQLGFESHEDYAAVKNGKVDSLIDELILKPVI